MSVLVLSSLIRVVGKLACALYTRLPSSQHYLKLILSNFTIRVFKPGQVVFCRLMIRH